MKRFQQQVNDWITAPPITCAPNTTLAKAYEMMQDNEIRRLLVVDREELAGIVTLSDILRALPMLTEQGDDATRLMMVTRKVSDVMTYDPVTVDPEDSILVAAERMLEYQISGLPVISGGRAVGIITESDIFRLVVEAWAEESELELPE